MIWAYRERASKPDRLAEGQFLRLYDHEGNECLGVVVRLEEEIVHVRADWGTWRDAHPVAVRPEGEQLDEVLLRAVRISSGEQTFATNVDDD